MFYIFQTTNLIFVGKIWDTQQIEITLRNSEYWVTLNIEFSVVSMHTEEYDIT